MPVTIDDLTSDFDAAIGRMYEEAKAEHDAIPPEMREAYYLAASAARLARLLELDAPRVIIEIAEDSLASKLRRRKRARRLTSARE